MDRESKVIWAGLELRTPAMLRAVEFLSTEQMLWLPPNAKNCIAWLLWHIAEVEDNWVRDKLLGEARRFPFGHSVKAHSGEYPSKSELLGYFHEVRALTHTRLESLKAEDFDREITDKDFGTIAIRELWSLVVTSCAWHSGQITLMGRLLG